MSLFLLLTGARAEGIVDFGHGDCIGADAQAAEIARNCGFMIIGFPPIKEVKRAFFKNDYELPPEDYLIRNRSIVASSSLLIACPLTAHEVQRSGTWATVRYARLINRPVVILEP